MHTYRLYYSNGASTARRREAVFPDSGAPRVRPGEKTSTQIAGLKFECCFQMNRAGEGRSITEHLLEGAAEAHNSFYNVTVLFRRCFCPKQLSTKQKPPV